MKRTLVLLLLVFSAVALLGACGGGDDSSSDTPPAPIDMRGKTEVEIVAKGGNQFTPNNIVVDQGTDVKWQNQDTIAHNVKKSADAVDFGGEFGVEAGQFGPGDTYSFTFDKAGQYQYTCTIHAGMSGSINVEGASTSTTTVEP
jgi:plastocyanin